MCMAIMAMATAPRIKAFGLISLIASTSVFAADIEFIPSIKLAETYTDNVLAESNNKSDSFVTDTGAALQTKITSRAFQFDLDGTWSRLFYTHDHDLDKNYTTLNANGLFAPWTSGPRLTFSAGIDNVARNTADNQYADLINGDTVETQNYSVGLVQSVTNSDFVLNASINTYVSKSDDNIGESDGYRSSLRFSNGSGVKKYFWEVSGAYNDRDNDGNTGRDYNFEAKVGFNTPIKLSPFYRYYDEDFSGSISTGSNNTATSSSGAGIRWQIAKHFNLDVSYNFVADDELTDDYVEAAINWQLSERTSIIAGYNQRFFGDSYNLNIRHRNRRLTNTITYTEQLEAFERDNFETYVSGNIWCPIGQPFDQDNCLDSNAGIDNPDEFIELDLLSLRPVEDNQFNLNKSYAWNSELKLSRTTFTLNVSGNERENLNQGNIDKYFNTSLSAKRRVSAQSDVTLTWRFNKNEYNSNNVDDALTQTDYYRIVSAAYNRKISNTISTDVMIEYRDRSSDRVNRDYEETRVALNFKKDF